jgi:hypothetical protein
LKKTLKEILIYKIRMSKFYQKYIGNFEELEEFHSDIKNYYLNIKDNHDIAHICKENIDELYHNFRYDTDKFIEEVEFMRMGKTRNQIINELLDEIILYYIRILNRFTYIKKRFVNNIW